MAKQWAYQGHVISVHHLGSQWLAYIYTEDNRGIPIKKLEEPDENTAITAAKKFVDELKSKQT